MATTAQAILVAVQYGQLELAAKWCECLARRQLSCGAFASESGRPSHFHTALAIRGLLAVTREGDAGTLSLHVKKPSPLNVHRSVGQAGKWLAAQVTSSGELDPSAAAPGSLDRFGPRNLVLLSAAALSAAAEVLNEPTWQAAANRVLHGFLRRHDACRWDGPLDPWLHGVEALAELGESKLAREALRRVQMAQRRSGAVPAMPDADWISTAGLAHLAVLWHELGNADLHRAGDRALAALRARQHQSGGFPAAWGRNCTSATSAESVSATIGFLRAAACQVRAAFATTSCDFPAEIDADDGRWQAVREWRGSMPASAAIIDVGCGRGRYLRRLREEFPQTRITGVDVSPDFLRDLPTGPSVRLGTQLRVPAASGEFDGAISVETLEHSLLPRQAVAELCRVVRPGGSVLIIDKDRRLRPLSIHQPWERWFSREEVAAWLAEHCDNIEARPIAHGQDQLRASRGTKGLFLCWTARKLGAAQVKHRGRAA